MQYRPAALALAFVAAATGCTAEIETAPKCDVPPEDVGLDVQLAGLDDAKSYFLEVRADGAELLIASTPEQRATLDETPLDDENQLLVAFFDSTLRLYIAEDDGTSRGPETMSVTIWSADGAMLAHEAFAPTYEDAATVDGTCDGFAVVTEHMSIPLPPLPERF
jgi:hypothetical protein